MGWFLRSALQLQTKQMSCHHKGDEWSWNESICAVHVSVAAHHTATTLLWDVRSANGGEKYTICVRGDVGRALLQHA